MDPDLPLPERIGRYRILRLLGRGGMGAVFEAEQDNPRRTVALKVVTTAVLGDDMRRRFELEAQVLGHLSHPCIAQIFEAGMFDGPGGAQPYFAMELIRGVPLGQYAREQGLDTRARLELIARICDGVAHAHERGVIHRDLKPDNILVDEAGDPKILDFGLARATDSDIQTASLMTDLGQIMGTIPYMSPEQAAGDPAAIDARSDVYSLGVVAYELVSGSMPYAADDPMVLEALRVVREEEPRPLSSVNRSLRGDVETIIGKALEKERERRYPRVSDLATDIRRHLADEPIRARPPSTGYQLRKFARRHRAIVVGTAAVFVALVIGLVGTVRGFLAAEADARRAQSTADFFRTILESVDPAVAQGADTTLFRAVLDDTAARIGSELAGRPRVAAGIHASMATAYFTIAEYESSLAEAEAAHALFVDDPGPDSLEAVEARHRAALALWGLGRNDESGEVTRANLERIEAALGSEHDLAFRVRAHLGVIDLDELRYDEAARWFEPILEYRRARVGADPDAALVAINCLGLARVGQGRFDEAETLLREVLDERVRTSGDDHPETIKALVNLGGLYSTQERWDEAERLFRDSMGRMSEIAGPDHANTLEAAENLAFLLRNRGRYEEALEMFRDLYHARVELHGPDDFRTITAERNLGTLYSTTGRLDEAERHIRRACEGLREKLGIEDRDTIHAMHALANLESKRGRSEESEALLAELFEVCARTFGEDDSLTLTLLKDLAWEWHGRGRVDEAEEGLRRVVDGWRRTLGPEHSETLMAGVMLARLLHDQGRVDEAMPLHAAFLTGWTSLYGDDHAYAIDVARKMSANLDLVERHAPHEAPIRALLAYHERTSAEDSTEVTGARLHLAQALVEQSVEQSVGQLREGEARELVERATDHCAADDGPLHAHWTFLAALTGVVDFAVAEATLLRAWEAAGSTAAGARTPIARRLAMVCDAAGRPDEGAYWRNQAATLVE